MHVLMIACRYETGGAPRSMKEMILRLSEKHGVMFTIALSKEGNLSKWCRENSIDYIISNHRTFAEPKEKNLMRQMRNKAVAIIRNKQAVNIIEKSIDMKSISLIHTNSNRDCLGALLSKKYNIPHVWHLREYGKQDYDVHFYFPFTVSFMNKNTKRFIAISQSVESAWKRQGLAPSKMVQIYNGVNTSSIIHKNYKKHKQIRIVFTGSIIESKGQLESIRALSLLEKDVREHFIIDFFFESAEPEYKQQIDKVVQEYNLDCLVNFCGSTNDIGKILHNYDVGITCSKSEAFGRVTVEYMAAGLITIASNTGANPEIIEDGENGFLYEYGNPESLSRILEKIYYIDVNEKQQIGQAAIERVEQNFTDKINAKNVYELYLDILKNRRNKSDVT